jgi:hypothetical protein
MNAVTDFFRCPDAFAPLQGPEGLSEKPHYFSIGPDVLCYGRTDIHVSGNLLPQVTATRSGLRLPFDLAQAVESFHYEKYPLRELGLSRLGPNQLLGRLYYTVRPFLPDGWRRMLQRFYLRDWRRLPFPSWPVDFSADLLLEKLLAAAMIAQRVAQVPFVWFWPEGASAAATMTHDVETESGRDFVPTLMDVDEHFGIKASYQLVPEDRYEVPRSLRQLIRTRGCEVAVHGLNHHGNLFAEQETFLKQATRINHYLREFEAQGFRSPCMYRQADWLRALDIRFDMSVPNVAHLEPQRGGCCTVFPYFIGDILELPLTTIQDYSLFYILGTYSIEPWQEQIGMILRRHGLLSFIAHPDYLSEDRAMNVYRALLAHLTMLSREEHVWLALPSEINRWWRQRRNMTVVLADGYWTVDGPGRDRARIAFARVDGDRLRYAIADAPTVAAGEEARLV